MSVKRYDFDCYAFYDSARLNVQECDDGDYVLHSDYAALEARHNALREEFEDVKDHNQYLEACLEDRNAEMMRHVRMYEDLCDAVAWEREFDEVLVWLVRTGRYPRDMASRYDLANERECARAEVDRLLQEPPC